MRQVVVLKQRQEFKRSAPSGLPITYMLKPIFVVLLFARGDGGITSATSTHRSVRVSQFSMQFASVPAL